MKLFSESRSPMASREAGRTVSMESFSGRARESDSMNRRYKSGVHQISTMTFNNQDTVLMRAETDVHVCFLHDNRIYIFKKIPSNGDEKKFIVRNPNSPSDVEETGQPVDNHVETLMREIILHMVTSPKYRLLNSMYVIFSLLDSTIFTAIVVTTIIFFATVNTEGNMITTETAFNIPITICIMLEIFYGILLNATHFWILRRVSIYIVLLFYLLYYGAIGLLGHAAGYSENHTHFLYVLLAIRFLAFALETLVDICVDLNIHNDLILINKPLVNSPNANGDNHSRYGVASIIDYLDVRHSMSIFPDVPTENCYVGSLLSWLPISIQYTTEGFLLEHITNSKTVFSFMTLYGGCFIQMLVLVSFAVLLGIIVFIAVMAVIFVGLFTDVITGRRHKGGFTNFVKEIVYHF